MEHTYAVIMAGGGGTRLWPVSRKEKPKQLLSLLGKETLFQSTIARLEKLFPPERILIVTVAELASTMRRFPQVTINVEVAAKDRLEDAADVWDAVKAVEAALDGTGRVLVRSSGTEPLVRVMVEAESEQDARRHAGAIVERVRSALG